MGTPVVYTSATLSLAALELLVRLSRRNLAGQQFIAVPADIPGDVRVATIERSELPSDWRAYPAPDALSEMGTRWATKQTTAVLAVPSVLIPSELNYLLSPRHPDFRKIRVGRGEPFSFDPRLWRRG